MKRYEQFGAKIGLGLCARCFLSVAGNFNEPIIQGFAAVE